MSKLIVGVGTGRCGTKSLVKLLSLQDQTTPTHERYGPKVRWNCPPNLWPLRLWRDTRKKDVSIACDVAFYWTPHIRKFLDWADSVEREVRVVGLKRDREETIDSYLKWKPNADHWSYHGYRKTQPDEWDHCYPALDTDSKREGIGLFWDRVYEILEGINDERVKVFDSFECFNTKKGVRSILEHCGYDDPNVETNIRIKAPSIDDARNSTQW